MSSSSLYTILTSALEKTANLQSLLLQPTALLGLPWMDVLGLPRLSIIMDQIFRTVNLHPSPTRPTFVQEVRS